MIPNPNYFQEKVWYIINTIQANQLFVHSGNLEVIFETYIKKKKKDKVTQKKKIQKKILPEILTICILNALVPNSAMLLIGGHGGGKTSIAKFLGRMFTGISLMGLEESIIRGHPQLTEEKIIATLNIQKLMKNGEEEVIWRNFSLNFWKIIDEVNRCSPYTQNILLSLLAEGKLKYYDSILDVAKYTLYATLNPDDSGTFELSAPFLDRFGISIPITMPKSQDLSEILNSQDEKLSGYDELVQIPQVLTEEQLLNIWFEVEKIPLNNEASNFINAIIREFTLCERIEKGNSNYLKPSTGLCSGCHYNIPEKIPCSNSDSILSVRVAKDLARYAKALTWLINMPEVSLISIITIAPYVISHRIIYRNQIINQAPFWGDKYRYTKHLLKIIEKRFRNRKDAYEITQNYLEGNGKKEGLDIMELMAKSDLIIAKDLFPLVNQLNSSNYIKKVRKINEAAQLGDIADLSSLKKELLYLIDFPNRGPLISKINKYLKILTLNIYNCSVELWRSIRFTIEGMIPEFSNQIKKTLQSRGTYRLKSEDLEMEINITGIKPADIVNFSFFGGNSANNLKELINSKYSNSFKSMDDLIKNVKDETQTTSKESLLKEREYNDNLKRKKKNNSQMITDEYFDDDFFN